MIPGIKEFSIMKLASFIHENAIKKIGTQTNVFYCFVLTPNLLSMNFYLFIKEHDLTYFFFI